MINYWNTVVVWLKIRNHDIHRWLSWVALLVVVWLKIRNHDIRKTKNRKGITVVVWLKIRNHDIKTGCINCLKSL